MKNATLNKTHTTGNTTIELWTLNFDRELYDATDLQSNDAAFVAQQETHAWVRTTTDGETTSLTEYNFEQMLEDQDGAAYRRAILALSK